MKDVSFKTYILFAISTAIVVMITQHSLHYNLECLISWSAAGIFFFLWRLAANRPIKPKSQVTKVKRLL